MPPWNPPGIFKKIQESKLGDAQGIPTLHQQPSGHFVETTFLSLYILCAILGTSFYFAFIFILFVCLSYSCWILSILFGRETRSTFLWNTLVLHLYLVEYSQHQQENPLQWRTYLDFCGAPLAHGGCATESSPQKYNSVAHGLGAPQNSHISVAHPNHMRHRILKKLKKFKKCKKKY